MPVRHVRYLLDGAERYGILSDAGVVEISDPLDGSAPTAGQAHPIDDIALLLPLDRSRVQKVIGVQAQDGRAGFPPHHPRLYGKLPSTLAGNHTDIQIPVDDCSPRCSGEMVVAMGRTVPRGSSEAAAAAAVWGLAVGINVYEPTWHAEERRSALPARLLSHSVDTWAILGDEVVARQDYSRLHLRTVLNGGVVSEVSTSDLAFGVEEVLAYVSRYITLRAGDLVFMGTPATSDAAAAIVPGDRIEVTLEGVGTATSVVDVLTMEGLSTAWEVGVG
jgi:2-keto-4-pentenoate hydratase/2-oxohepta-3-ene-1,7-dioic acid hydratase in catechol pathway